MMTQSGLLYHVLFALITCSSSHLLGSTGMFLSSARLLQLENIWLNASPTFVLELGVKGGTWNNGEKSEFNAIMP